MRCLKLKQSTTTSSTYYTHGHHSISAPLGQKSTEPPVTNNNSCDAKANTQAMSNARQALLDRRMAR